MGEIGRLKETRHYPTRCARVFLIIEHEGTEYIGCLMFDDVIFCEKVANRLPAFQGLPLEIIGSSEIYLPRDGLIHKLCSTERARRYARR